MTKTKFFTIASLMIILFQVNIFSQQVAKKSYNNSDLYALKQKAEDKLEGSIFRITTITEKFERAEKSPTEYEKNIIENLPPDRNRMLVEEKTKNGIQRREYIDIGRERFFRENGGDWKIFKPSGSGMGAGSGSGNGDNVKVEYTEEKNFIMGEILNGKKADRYEQILRYTFTYPNRVEKEIKTETYWFNSDGFFVKKLEETRSETDKTIYRTTTYYEYNIKLKIEKPIVK